MSPANAAYSAAELTHQLRDSKAKALFTCLPLLPTALEAASNAGLPRSRIYLIDLPAEILGGAKSPAEYKTLAQFVEAGKSLPKLEQLKWGSGDGARRTAFLCYSSGTSGLPVSAAEQCPCMTWLTDTFFQKGVMISHRNVIANTLQITAFEESWRDSLGPAFTEVVLGLLPQSHIYALVVICHVGPYRGDQVVILPKFEFKSYLSAIQDFKINSLFLVSLVGSHMLETKCSLLLRFPRSLSQCSETRRPAPSLI